VEEVSPDREGRPEMFCTGCGNTLSDADKYCAQCGQANRPGPGEPPKYEVRPRLSRSIGDKKIAGVCSGIAKYLGWDVTVVRVVFLGLLIFHGIGLLAYLIAWICMPRDDEGLQAVRV
jgi:phage shock protein PspC (stress-responsive transcriptional regulator)